MITFSGSLIFHVQHTGGNLGTRLGRAIIFYWEVVPIAEVDKQATPINPEV